MFGFRPVILLVKAPVPEPSEVLLFAVVGLAEVLQHTPRAVTEAPPSLVILPPLITEEEVIVDPALVVRVGNEVRTEGPSGVTGSFWQLNTNNKINKKINLLIWLVFISFCISLLMIRLEVSNLKNILILTSYYDLSPLRSCTCHLAYKTMLIKNIQFATHIILSINEDSREEWCRIKHITV